MERSSIQERRKLKRRSLTYYMLVLDVNTHQTIGHLVDITPNGMMMDCAKPFPLEKDFRFRFDIMPDLANKDHITFTARSKWCLPDAVEPYLYDIGFSFINPSPGDTEIIRRIAEKYAAQEGYRFPPR